MNCTEQVDPELPFNVPGNSETSRQADESVGEKKIKNKPDRREYFYTRSNLAVKFTAMMQLRPRI